jgi:hypothetical protein
VSNRVGLSALTINGGADGFAEFLFEAYFLARSQWSKLGHPEPR